MDAFGFVVDDQHTLDIAGATARRYRHAASGAELLALDAKDANLSFAVGFATPPRDDTGVAHILEHMVLAGSQKYPLRDPFFDMVKGSLAGFLNALTYPDRTVYPFATENRQDYLNLLDVYLDAVFAPRLARTTFAQEGWHLERAGEGEDALALRGVVFNEMKGAFGDPNRALHQAEAAGLLPDTPYAFESGGDPAAIPELTYEALTAFHAEHYHPSRAKFVVHGDVPLEEVAARIAPYLEGVTPLPPVPPPALQPPFEAPRTAQAPYPADANDKALATVAWALPALEGPGEELLLEVLEHALVGTPAAPLRRALLDSGVGEAFLGGLDTTARQPTFHAGLRGVDPDRIDEVHALVRDTVRDVARVGFDPEDVRAARNRLEFDLREMDAGGGQQGLSLAFTALDAWMHGRDPVRALDFDAALADLDARLAADGGADHGASVLADLLARRLVDNPHRVDAASTPDPDLSARRDADERARLGAWAEAMTEDDWAALEAAHAELRAAQETPDSPEARATLPTLHRGDVRDPTPDPVPEVEARDGAELLRYDLPTRGLGYVDVAFDLRAVPEVGLAHVGTLGRYLLETGTASRSLAELTRAIDAETGGIGAGPDLAAGVGEAPGLARFVVRGSALGSKADALADLMIEVLREADFGDVAVLRRLTVERLARRRAALERAGHRFALRRLAAHGAPEARVEEHLSGLASLATSKAAADLAEDDPDALRAQLEGLRQALLVRAGTVAAVHADDAAEAPMRAATRRLVDALPAGGAATGDAFAAMSAPAPAEGWRLPGQVFYVATGRTLQGGAPLPGSWLVAARWLSSEVFLPRIRFQGGAYGAGAVLDPLRGAFRTFSYRDPNFAETLAVMAEAPERLEEAAGSLDERDLETLIIGTLGGLDPHEMPAERGYRALARRLRGSLEQRERLRREILGTTRDAFAELAEAIRAAGPPRVVALGPEAGLRALEGELGLVIREPA